ncbi:hypothetical protein BDD12DRAFT_166791 [Trichophaea hybrida]|nr:hypothetical protein BDD12DRAFT_166791 [Trichophaea hybrida]
MEFLFLCFAVNCYITGAWGGVRVFLFVFFLFRVFTVFSFPFLSFLVTCTCGGHLASTQAAIDIHTTLALTSRPAKHHQHVFYLGSHYILAEKQNCDSRASCIHPLIFLPPPDSRMCLSTPRRRM